MLTIEFDESQRPPVLLDKRRLRIGAGEDNEIRLVDGGVEDVHAEIDILSDGIYLVNLAGDSAPVAVNGATIAERKALTAGDIITIGGAEVRVGQYDSSKTQIRPTVATWLLHSEDKTHDTFEVPPGQVITLGRSTDCDVVIPDQFVSRRHAEFYVKGGHLFVKDLDSTQGTFVNGEQVSEAELQGGDEIRLERFRFRSECRLGPGDDAPAEKPEPDTDSLQTRISPVAAEAKIAAEMPEGPAAPADKPVDTPPPEKAAPGTVDTTPATQAPVAEKAKAPVESAAQEGEKADEEDSDNVRRGNWWERQDEGPKGTTIVKVSDLVKDVDTTAPPPAIETDRPVLVGMSGSCKDQRFELQPGKLVVGRGEKSDIRLDDAQVSETHAQLVGDGRRWKVINLIAANGTFVNGKKIQTAYLRSGDVIGFGGVTLQFADSSATGGINDAETRNTRKLLVAIAGGMVAAVVVAMAIFAWLKSG